MAKLVVHIGHGKTGSSSIQQSLLAAAPKLAAQHVKYLGLMLEHAANEQRPLWQTRSGSNLFFEGISPELANAELSEILAGELLRLESDGFSVAIWSNEWLFTRSRSALPALREMRKLGHQVELQCYVRRHDKWAQSAYAQWGLKHKSYAGPIRDFQSWLAVFGDSEFRFAPTLSVWEAEFGTDLRVFNFDCAGDVVQHFALANSLREITSISDNISPDAVVTAAQVVFNSRSISPVLPAAFDGVHMLVQKGDETATMVPPLDRLLPSAETLAALVNDRADDVLRINEILDRSGEPPLTFDDPPQKFLNPSPWEMDQFLLKLIYGLVEELNHIRAQVTALNQQLAVALTERDQ